jgi:hypothetical protein
MRAASTTVSIHPPALAHTRGHRSMRITNVHTLLTLCSVCPQARSLQLKLNRRLSSSYQCGGVFEDGLKRDDYRRCRHRVAAPRPRRRRRSPYTAAATVTLIATHAAATHAAHSHHHKGTSTSTATPPPAATNMRDPIAHERELSSFLANEYARQLRMPALLLHGDRVPRRVPPTPQGLPKECRMHGS